MMRVRVHLSGVEGRPPPSLSTCPAPPPMHTQAEQGRVYAWPRLHARQAACLCSSCVPVVQREGIYCRLPLSPDCSRVQTTHSTVASILHDGCMLGCIAVIGLLVNLGVCGQHGANHRRVAVLACQELGSACTAQQACLGPVGRPPCGCLACYLLWGEAPSSACWTTVAPARTHHLQVAVLACHMKR